MTNKKEKIITEISARLTEMLSDAAVSPNYFASKLEYSRAQTIYDILNGKSAPSYDFFKRFVLSDYSVTYNIEWLLTGRGSMLRDELPATTLEPTIIYRSDPKDVEIIAAKDMIIQRDAELITSLQCRIKDLDKRLTIHAPDLGIARSADTTTTGTKSTHK